MTPEQFAYWLQGYAELNTEPPNAEQWQAIRDHLALVFNKVTPDYFEQFWPPQPPLRWVPTAIDPTVTCSGVIAVHDETARLTC